MRPKSKLAILVALFAGVGVLAATAAFDTVEADRTADVETAGDAEALLGLEAGTTALAENTDDGLLQITLVDEIDDEEIQGEGLNLDAVTTVLPDEGADGLFTASNNGGNDIEFGIQDFDADGDVDIYFIVGADAGSDSEGVDDTTNPGDDGTLGDVGLNTELVTTEDYDVLQASDGSDGGTVTIDSGEDVEVGIVFDVGTDLGAGDDVFGGDITITADSTGN